MGAFISKQPNGKYCRFSTIVDCHTHINMTMDDYIKICKQRGISKRDAIDTIENYLYDFTNVRDYFLPNNMTEIEFEEVINRMNDPNGKFEIL